MAKVRRRLKPKRVAALEATVVPESPRSPIRPLLHQIISLSALIKRLEEKAQEATEKLEAARLTRDMLRGTALHGGLTNGAEAGMTQAEAVYQYAKAAKAAHGVVTTQDLIPAMREKGFEKFSHGHAASIMTRDKRYERVEKGIYRLKGK